MKGKYLITTDNWFIAPDGKNYRAVWGEAQTMTAVEALGVEPNRNSANWMVRVGSEEHHIILAGCQIHYAVSCPDRPNQEDTLQKYADDKEKTLRDNCIYIPEPPTQKDVEIIEKEEVEWLTDKQSLICILEGLNDGYFENSLDRRDIIDSTRRDNMERYKFEKLPHKEDWQLDIVWKSGNRKKLRNQF